MELRPLGIGELFDRAITIYVRQFLPIFTIMAVTAIPVLLLNYLCQSHLPATPAFGDLLRHVEVSKAYNARLYGNGFYWAQQVLGWVSLICIYPFTLNAVAYGVGESYTGKAISFANSYRASLALWKETFATIFWQAWSTFKVLALGFAAPVLLGALAFGGILLARASGGLAAILGVVEMLATLVILALIAGVLFLAVPAYMALTFGMNSLVIERLGPREAAAGGFRRIFKSGGFWRTYGFGLGVFALDMAFYAMCAYGLGLLHQPLLYYAGMTLSAALVGPLFVVLTVVYYFDFRVRHEAYDLEAELAALT